MRLRAAAIVLVLAARAAADPLTDLGSPDVGDVARGVAAIEAGPADADARFAAARACEDKLADPARALRLYQRILAEQPDARAAVAARRRADELSARLGAHGEFAAEVAELAHLRADADKLDSAEIVRRGDALAAKAWPGAGETALWLARWAQRRGDLRDARARFARIAAATGAPATSSGSGAATSSGSGAHDPATPAPTTSSGSGAATSSGSGATTSSGSGAATSSGSGAHDPATTAPTTSSGAGANEAATTSPREPVLLREALRGGASVAIEARDFAEARRIAERLPAGDLERASLLYHAARGEQAIGWDRDAWICAIAALAALIASLVEACARGGWRAPRVRPPLEVIVIGPIALGLAAYAYADGAQVAPVVAAIAGGGVGLAWIGGAALEVARARGRSTRLRGALHAIACLAGVAGIAFLAVWRCGLLEP